MEVFGLGETATVSGMSITNPARFLIDCLTQLLGSV